MTRHSKITRAKITRAKITRAKITRAGITRICAAAAFLAIGAAGAQGKDARCFTTDDGEYACDFQPFGGDGSFTISAPGKPTFTLTMDSPATAFGSAIFEPGGRTVPLPGLYRREAADPACWANNSTDTKICAW